MLQTTYNKWSRAHIYELIWKTESCFNFVF